MSHLSSPSTYLLFIWDIVLLCFPGWPLTPVLKWAFQQAGLQTLWPSLAPLVCSVHWGSSQWFLGLVSYPWMILWTCYTCILHACISTDCGYTTGWNWWLMIIKQNFGRMFSFCLWPQYFEFFTLWHIVPFWTLIVSATVDLSDLLWPSLIE